MNWDIVKGNWKQLQGELRKQWGKSGNTLATLPAKPLPAKTTKAAIKAADAVPQPAPRPKKKKPAPQG